MGLFAKKLTFEQEAQLKKYADELSSICSPCTQALTEFWTSVKELYTYCYTAGTSGKVEPVGVEHLIQPAKKSSENYMDILATAQSKFSEIQPEKWFPKKYRKENESWKLFFDGSLGFLPMVIESLGPPDPLKNQARYGGKEKLHMFLEGMALVARFASYQT